jgi:CRISPR system Cascade subunit CasA
MTTFSLISQRWIRCQARDGSEMLLSLREVFDGGHSVVGLRGDSPTQDYAVLRVLLAIVLRAHGSALDLGRGEEFDFVEWWSTRREEIRAGEADEVVLGYLDVFADRFDLLNGSAPFMQVADLHTSKDTQFPVSRIIPEAESDYFTMRTGESRETLALAESARWLIHAQAYDYSGIKSGAVGDPRVKGGRGYPIGQGWTGLTGGTTILGSTLHETLLLNATEDGLLGGPGDRPVWERRPDGPTERSSNTPGGVADLLTWQSRRIRLFSDGDRVTAVLVSNGDQIPAAGANVLRDPMTPYRYSKNKSTKQSTVFYPRPYETSRTMWRSLEPLICLDGDHPDTGILALGKGESAPKRPATLSQLAELRSDVLRNEQSLLSIRLTSTSYGPQASSASTTVDARIDIPRSLLQAENLYARRMVLTTAKATHASAVALGQFNGELLRAAGGEYAFQPGPTESLLSDLEPRFRTWLRDLPRDSDSSSIDAAAATWQDDVRLEILGRAQTLLRGAGPQALIGRETTENDRVVLHSAGIAYSRLMNRLHDSLPLAIHQRSTPPDPTSTAPKETPDDH